MPSSYDLLERLINAPSPSGYEQPASAVFREACEPFSDNVTTDILGNTYAVLNPSGKRAVMLAGHCDEIGFQVTSITPAGYIYFERIGGQDPEIVVSQRVVVHTESGPIHGVIGKRPIHVMDEEERKQKSRFKDMFIDIGSHKGLDISDRVQLGDPVTFAPNFQRLQGNLAASHAFDNKIGAYVVAETVRLVAESKKLGSNFSLHGVSTVQEEIGLRGARTASYKTQAEIGIAIDVDHATDYPGIDKRHKGFIQVGGGPVITRGPNINGEVYKRLIAAAENASIPVQINARPRETGTDANIMQVSHGGMATGLIGIPLRYMHSPCELVSLDDITNAAKLLAQFIIELDDSADFTPSMRNLHAPRMKAPVGSDEESNAEVELD